MKKLNKAEKFVVKQVEEGKTRQGVVEAIFWKFGNYTFPPEYKKALDEFCPETDNEPTFGVDRLDDFVCDDCGNCHELCFCGDNSGIRISDNDTKCPGEESVGCGGCPQKTFCTTIAGVSSCFICDPNPCVCVSITLEPLPKIPEPGTQAHDNMVNFIRADLESGMSYTEMIESVKKRMAEEGRDFNAEFKKWKEKGK